MSDDDEIIKKKVTPYPISAFFGEAPNVTRGKIVKLTVSGFLAEVESRVFSVHEKHGCEFILPVSGEVFRQIVLVVKTYDLLTKQVARGGQIKRLIEFHFAEKVDQEAILRFLAKIGQAK